MKTSMNSRNNNTKMLKKIDTEMKQAYLEEFGHTTDVITDKNLDLKEQVENFVKNVKFWNKHVKSFDEIKKMSPYETNKRTYCKQAHTHLMKQLPKFPEAIQKSIMDGNLT